MDTKLGMKFILSPHFHQTHTHIHGVNYTNFFEDLVILYLISFLF